MIRAAPRAAGSGASPSTAPTPFVRNRIHRRDPPGGQETQGLRLDGPGPSSSRTTTSRRPASGALRRLRAVGRSAGPSDIVIRRTTSPGRWRGDTGGWAVRNCSSEERAQRPDRRQDCSRTTGRRRVGLRGVFTVRAQGPRAPWSTIEHVRFENNVVRHSVRRQHPRYDNNDPAGSCATWSSATTCSPTSTTAWGGSGIFLQSATNPPTSSRAHTVCRAGTSCSVYGGTAARRAPPPASASPQLVSTNSYGIFGNASDGQSGDRDLLPPERDHRQRHGRVAPPASTRPANVFPTVADLMAQFGIRPQRTTGWCARATCARSSGRDRATSTRCSGR